MGDDDPLGSNAALARTLIAARDAATVARLLAARPPCCPLVRAAFARVLAQTLNAWSFVCEPHVRPRAAPRRTLEPALQTAHTLQPRKGEAR
jgi:hypothetical protein